MPGADPATVRQKKARAMQDRPDRSAQPPTMPVPSSSSGLEPHRIVVVGGGAGGLELATRLGDRLGKKDKAKITLVEKSRTHVWKPRLYEIAAGSLDVARTEVDYLAQGYWHSFQFRYGEMSGIDRTRKLRSEERRVGKECRL